MFLRKLTGEELGSIKKAKDAIKEQRQKLQGDIKKQRMYVQDETKRLKSQMSGNFEKKNPVLEILRFGVTTLQNQLNALPIITGKPVIVKVGDESLLIDYELLNKFDRLLDKSNLSVQYIKISGKLLIIRYGNYGQSGSLELFEPAEYLTEILTNLPVVIDLRE